MERVWGDTAYVSCHSTTCRHAHETNSTLKDTPMSIQTDRFPQRLIFYSSRHSPPNDAERASRVSHAVTTKSSTNEITITMDQTAVVSSVASSATNHETPVNTGASKTYKFDKVFGPESSQRDLYDESISQLVDESTEGFNCTVFAYGQTGTGKTFTMEGKGSGETDIADDCGIVPRALRQIFNKLENKKGGEFTVKCMFLELYNEEITDLLHEDDLSDDPGTNATTGTASMPALKKSSSNQHRLMEGKDGVSVDGLTEVNVGSVSEALSFWQTGAKKRRTAETLCNKVSSRSHSVFTITVTSREPCTSQEGEDLIKHGKLHLVDLAGSENVGKSGVAEKGATSRSREAGEINKSLLTLGRVITALVDKLAHVPYRDSKLTRLLRDALGGKSKTCIVATIGPSVTSAEETVATAEYASRARSVRCRPEVNRRVTKTALVRELQKEVGKLKLDLDATRKKNGVYLSNETFEEREREFESKKAAIDRLEGELKQALAELTEISNLFETETEKLKGAESRLGDVEGELSTMKTQSEEAAKELAATSAEAETLKNHATEQKEKLKLAESMTTQLFDWQRKTKVETFSLFNHAERQRARIENGVCESLNRQKSDNESAAERLRIAETNLRLAREAKEEKKLEREERIKQHRASVFEAAFGEIQKAKAVAVKACDDAMAVLVSLKSEVLSDENENGLDEDVDSAYAEVAAAAEAARTALALAASVTVPEDTPTGATPTRGTSTALSLKTPKYSRKISGIASTPESIAARPKVLDAKTPSLPRVPLRKLGDNLEETYTRELGEV